MINAVEIPPASRRGRNGRDPRSLAGEAYQTIRDAIRTGILVQGQKLRFADLQRMCGTSVSPIREALARLTVEGFTTVEERRGFNVAALTRAELHDITLNRLLLESEALRLSIAHGDAHWESRVLAAHHLLTRVPRSRHDLPSATRPDWDRHHVDFHRALLSGCASPILIESCRRLSEKADCYRRVAISVEGPARDVAAEHREIAEHSVARRMPEAVDALRRHYRATANAVEHFLPPSRTAPE